MTSLWIVYTIINIMVILCETPLSHMFCHFWQSLKWQSPNCSFIWEPCMDMTRTGVGPCVVTYGSFRWWETAIGWRPYGPSPVLIGPDRIPWFCFVKTSSKLRQNSVAEGCQNRWDNGVSQDVYMYVRLKDNSRIKFDLQLRFRSYRSYRYLVRS